MSDTHFDVIVLGAGPGGYLAAERLGHAGKKVALVEEQYLGGTCLNVGCIPTKTLLNGAKNYLHAKEASQFGVDASGVAVNWTKMQAWKDQVVKGLVAGVAATERKAGVTVINGRGHLDAPGHVTVEGTTYTSDHVIIATGSVPAMPPLPGTQDNPALVDSTGILSLPEVPSRLAIIGGGVIGVEFATVYNGFGSHVTVVEALDRLIPTVDKELARSLKMSLQKDGIDVLTKCPVVRIEQADGRLAVVYTEKDEEKSIPADAVLMAVGRRSDVPSLLSEQLQHLAGERGRLAVNEHYQSASPSIYGIGDAIGGIELAHTATAEGRNAVAHMNGQEPPIRMETVPTCIYSVPEIASVGISADEAKEQGIEIITKKYAMGANGKTVLEDLGRGTIKLIADADSHILLGAQLMCGRATDLVGELALAISNKLTLEDVASTIHPHPTFVEAIAEAAR